MNCPRCSHSLTETQVDGVNLNACFGGCGGIWFDWLEFKKFDESHEANEEFISKIAHETNNPVNTQGKLDCPKCDGIVLMTFFHSAKQKVEIDHCASCGGHWLDGGELVQIHETTPNDDAKLEAFEQMMSADIQPQIDELLKNEEKNPGTAKRIANALKFFSPSYHLKK